MSQVSYRIVKNYSLNHDSINEESSTSDLKLRISLLEDLVDRPGFEPGTSRVPSGYSSRLNYRPTLYYISTSIYLSLTEF